MNINYNLNSLSVYRNLLTSKVLQNFIVIFDILNSSDEKKGEFCEIISLYSEICSELYKRGGNLSEYIKDLILYDENVFSYECSMNGIDLLSLFIKKAAFHDIEILNEISLLSSLNLKRFIKEKFSSHYEIIDSLSDYETETATLSSIEIAEFYEKHSFGNFARYRAFQFTKDKIFKPVENLDDIKLSDLKLYEHQRQKLLDNTLGLLNNGICLNALLYGDRGTGKSSTVKAILNEYSYRGLRMVQLIKDDLTLLPLLMEKLSKIPLKFIIFIDDLTFNENDCNFGAMKTALEGSLSKQPSNIAIYVTTNRRHLIKETFSSRSGDEVHRGDTIDETVSLSDRFGLNITFSSPSKDSYLEIVRQIADDKNLCIERKELFSGAERFALLKNGRTPRFARQYVDSLLCVRKNNQLFS